MTTTQITVPPESEEFCTSVMKIDLTSGKTGNGLSAVSALYSSVPVRDSHPASYTDRMDLHKILITFSIFRIHILP